jgi:hypothetical protein
MVIEMLLLFNNGEDLVLKDLNYLISMPIRGQHLFLRGFRDSLRLRAKFRFNSYFSLIFLKKSSLDLFAFI